MAWQHLQDYVLGRTLLVTNRGDWPPEQIVAVSRMQSHNERAFRDFKDPGGASMLPLRHRGDQALTRLLSRNDPPLLSRSDPGRDHDSLEPVAKLTGGVAARRDLAKPRDEFSPLGVRAATGRRS